VSVPPAPPILLASTSPQRRAILEQLGIPFDVLEPRYVEDDPPDADAVDLVQRHARAKAESVGCDDERPVLGVDTAVVLEGRIYGKAANAAEAEATLEALSGKTHAVASGLCLRTPAWEKVCSAVTRVSFRPLTARDLA
jgi:septum formation protein